MVNFHRHQHNHHNYNRQRAFTMLEILIAMAIAAVIGVSAMSLLDGATVAHKNIQEQGNRYNQIERALFFLSNDIKQLAPRPFRDEFGDKKNNLTSDDSIGTTHLSFTRLGRRNPAKLARSNLEKLTYVVDKGELQRISYTYPDGMTADQGLNRTLLDKVESMKIAFFDGEEWNDFWPVDNDSSGGSKASSNSLPVAIKISLELEDVGLIERLYVVSDRREA